MLRHIPPVYERFLRTRGRAELGQPGLTLRSLVVGLVLVLCVCLGAQYSLWLVGSSELSWSYFPVAVGTPFVVLLLLNTLLKCVHPAAALNQSELVTILIMGLAVSGVPVFTVGSVMSVVTTAHYGADDINGWQQHVLPYLPDWAVLSDPEAVRQFYEGGADRVPVELWLEPMGWWLSLLLAVYLVSFCVIVLLRRQWVDRERLPFPLAEVPLLLTQTSRGARVPDVMRNRLFWIGCAVPGFVFAFNIVGYFHVGMPQIPMFTVAPVTILPHATVQPIIVFPIIGFCYLVSTSFTFSIWFFYLLTAFEGGTLGSLGVQLQHPDAFVYGWSPISWQSFGAFFALVTWSLVWSRRHLVDVARHVWRGADMDDGAELLPLRWAAVGALSGSLYIGWWMYRSGLTPVMIGLLLVGAFVVYVGITRLVVQTGVPYLTTPMSAQGMVLALTGTGVGAPALVGLALSYGWMGDVQSLLMPTAAHAAKLNELCRHRRRLAIAMLLALLLGFVVSSLFLLYLCYDTGGVNFRSWFFQPLNGPGARSFNAVVQQSTDPWGPDPQRGLWFSIGFVAYSVLTWLSHRLPWWPLHPIGLPLASVWMTKRIVFSVFIAWAVKSFVLRFGGAAAYRRLRPFFLGLVVGFFLGMGCSFAVDVLFFYGSGHPIING